MPLLVLFVLLFFFFNDTATTEIYTLSLHDALPILEILGKIEVRNAIGIRLEKGQPERRCHLGQFG